MGVYSEFIAIAVIYRSIIRRGNELNVVKYLDVNYTMDPAVKDCIFVGRLPQSFSTNMVRYHAQHSRPQYVS